MKFNCAIPNDIKANEKIVLPINMNQPLERGERLESILNAVKSFNYQSQLTILVCDYLNRHNCNSDEEAIQQGDVFINAHKHILQNFHIIRWKEFISSRDPEVFAAKLSEVQNKSNEGSRFYNKIQKTWEKCLSANQSFEASIKYQVEEYAAVLCMKEFGHLFYPKRITNALAYLYNFIDGQKPHYHHIKISELKETNKLCENQKIFSLAPMLTL